MLRYLWIGLLLANCGACTTIRSNLYSSDGCSPERVKRHLKGTPTTLPVASHIMLQVVETRYLSKTSLDFLKITPEGGTEPQEVRQRSLKHHLILKPELFTVDVKRPAAGPINYRIDYRDKANDVYPNDHQELSQIATVSYDQTIVKTADLLSTILKLTRIPVPGKIAAASTLSPEQYEKLDSVIACEIFDLRDPNLDERIRSFVAAYFDNDQCRLPCPFGAECQGPNCIPKSAPGH